tara:strand:- start:3551 stop:4936 length:1386 start_codon:yes stop_codon:yes gene_type:complete
MDKLNLNLLLNRKECENKFIESLKYFEENKEKLLTKRGIYIYGAPGSGKTFFVKNILKKLDYDIVMYDAGDVRNKSVIETITKHNMSDKNVLSMFKKEVKNIAIIMDEIDGMNNGDKGGINSLIKLIRPKKTNKQKKEDTTMIPIICIGNYHVDKKIKEMMKICTTIELKMPTNVEVNDIISILMPDMEIKLKNTIISYVQSDLRKLISIYNIYKNHKEILKNNLIHKIFEKKNYNEDTKNITYQLLTNKYNLNMHTHLMNETDRTSVGLLFHENIIDYLKEKDNYKNIEKYITLLKNFVFSDYIDRITFQKQIWIFNEMTSLVKTMYNNNIFHEVGAASTIANTVTTESTKTTESTASTKSIATTVTTDKNHNIRFTKVLTKYSTEYNNTIFIQILCNKLVMDKKDLFSFFIKLREDNDIDKIAYNFNNENYDISKLDISRLYRYIDKFNEKYIDNISLL